jgi:arsenical pump membrane protein
VRTRQTRSQHAGLWIARLSSSTLVRPPLRLTPQDAVAIGLLLAGAGCVLTGLLSRSDATGTVERILPLLVFLGAVMVLAELTAAAQVFEAIATRLAILAAGNYLWLFLLSVIFASSTTAALNLDTTAVLLTPVLLTTARRIGMSQMPLAMTNLWLANTASLLLPVSNLTNLLAANRVALPPGTFAQRMLLPEVLSVAATGACLWIFYWRRGRRGAERFLPPPQHRPADRVLFVVAAAACLIFVACVVAHVALQVASLVCAGVVFLAFLFRDRGALHLRLIPWRLLVFVTGLFLVVQTVSNHELHLLVHAVVGDSGGTLGVIRAAGTGAVFSNLLNNLPTYVAGEAVVPVANHRQLLGLLIGTNVGPIVTPWASLATLLWYERCRADGLRVSWSRFVISGAVTASLALASATLGLVLVG